MDTRKVVRAFDVPVANGNPVKFTVGERFAIGRNPLSAWITSLDRPGIQLKVTNEFVDDLLDLGFITQNLVGLRAH